VVRAVRVEETEAFVPARGGRTTVSRPTPAATATWQRLFGRSDRMRRMAETVRAAADSERPVLIQGETGTGKERVAEAMHALSPRWRGPLVKVRCSSLEPTQVEAELFGNQPHGDTAAVRTTRGQFDVAQGGSLLLDDVDGLPVGFHDRLLGVLDDGAFVRRGGSSHIATDARIIAVTQRDLSDLAQRGAFSPRLYARLAGDRIVLPPLRDRREEIGALAEAFRQEFCRDHPFQRGPFAPETIDLMGRYSWPGNVRELENFVKRYVVLGDEPGLQEVLRRRV
jgi:DNA-binding NtrC family response regulator